MAVTPVVLLLALMASASARALLVVASVGMAVPLILREPLFMPVSKVLPPSLVPARPKVPPPTEPSWKEMVVLAPRPIFDSLLDMPPVVSVCACAI
ncbi:hypothetical protein D3C72_1829520 [compost metagenome]